MKMPYKKVYVEITNRCNLSCDFCIHNHRKIEDLSLENFKIILEKLKLYTNYLYFHVLGEPLLHPDINEFIDLASKDYFVNITTNGYLINRIQYNKNIRQLNISLHSFDPKYHISLIDYLNKVFGAVDKLVQQNTYISLRLWTNNLYSNQIIEYINNRYNCDVCLDKNFFKISPHIFIHTEQEFIWPDLKNHYYNDVGSCYGLRDHFGILVNGTIVPCCLDSMGSIDLGNIYEDDLKNVLFSLRALKMKEGFQKHRKIEEFCKHCSFLKKGNKSS